MYSHRRPIPSRQRASRLDRVQPSQIAGANPITGTSGTPSRRGIRYRPFQMARRLLRSSIRTRSRSIPRCRCARSNVCHRGRDQREGLIGNSLHLFWSGGRLGFLGPHNDTATTSQSSGLGMRMPSVNVVVTGARVTAKAQPWLSRQRKYRHELVRRRSSVMAQGSLVRKNRPSLYRASLPVLQRNDRFSATTV